MELNLEILHEQGAVFVLNKPGGLLTQAPPGVDSLEHRFRQWVKAGSNHVGNVYVGVPHRLDRPVSGAIVLTRNVRAAHRISQQFEQRTVKKIYWAVVEGLVDDEAGTWKDWMRKIPDEAKSEIVSADHPEAKQAILHYQVLARDDKFSFVQIELETGRTHQIRLQCSAHGYPVIGDGLYGAKFSFGPPSLDERQQWIALHARQLVFEHPIERTPIDITAPLSEHWVKFDDLVSRSSKTS